MGISYLYIGLECVPKDGYYPDYKYLSIMLIITGMVGGSINSSSGRAVMMYFNYKQRSFAMSISSNRSSNRNNYIYVSSNK